MIWAYLRYIPLAIILYALKIATFPLAFVFCLFVRRAPEEEITGYPNAQLGDKPRDHIAKLFWWASTFDDCADAYWYSGRRFTLKWLLWLNVTQEQYDACAFVRYCYRLAWMWRNPCYTVARWMGYQQDGMVITKHKDQDDLWKSGKQSVTYWTAVNAKGQKAFLYQAQFYFYKQRCVELVFGYKIPWNHDDPTNKAMLACRFKFGNYALLPAQES